MHCDITWGEVEASEQAEFLERVNAELATEDIPEVDRAILSWRVSKAISSHKWGTYSG
jgi:hypothetical protein